MKLIGTVKYLAFALVILMIACLEDESFNKEYSGENSFEVGDTTVCKLNQLYTSSDMTYELILDSLNDSRCPEGVQCVWAGEVTVYGRWRANNDEESFEIHTVLTDQSVYPASFHMEVIEATPYPVFGTPVNPEGYRIKLLICQSVGMN